MCCLWMEMFAICHSAASPIDHECTVCQIFFHSFWLPKNETYFGSSPQQAKLTVNGSLKPHGSLSSVLISQKTWDGSTSQSRALHTGNTCLQWTDYKRALPEGKQNSWPGCLMCLLYRKSYNCFVAAVFWVFFFLRKRELQSYCTDWIFPFGKHSKFPSLSAAAQCNCSCADCFTEMTGVLW